MRRLLKNKKVVLTFPFPEEINSKEKETKKKQKKCEKGDLREQLKMREISLLVKYMTASHFSIK